MNFYPAITQTLGTLAVVALAMALALWVALAVPAGRGWLRETLSGHERHPVGWGAFVALIAMSGSLYLSDGAGLLPCLLCWYQRVAMYPLVVVLGVGLFKGDGGVWRYGLPLALIGLVISTYHVALQLNPSIEITTCDVGAPCSLRYLAIFGWVSIPVMAGAAFLLIAALMVTVAMVQGGGDLDAAAEEAQAAADPI